MLVSSGNNFISKADDSVLSHHPLSICCIVYTKTIYARIHQNRKMYIGDVVNNHPCLVAIHVFLCICGGGGVCCRLAHRPSYMLKVECTATVKQTEYTVKVECAATWSVVKLAMLKSSWLSWHFTSALC